MIDKVLETSSYSQSNGLIWQGKYVLWYKKCPNISKWINCWKVQFDRNWNVCHLQSKYWVALVKKREEKLKCLRYYDTFLIEGVFFCFSILCCHTKIKTTLKFEELNKSILISLDRTQLNLTTTKYKFHLDVKLFLFHSFSSPSRQT